MKFRMLVMAALVTAACGLSQAQAPAAKSSYVYTVRTQGTPRTQGSVNASGIAWQCDASGCTATGPWPAPGIAACRALAQQIGPIRSYGHPGRQLSAPELEKCNAGVAPASTAGGVAAGKPANKPGSNTPSVAHAGITPQLRQGMQLRTQHYSALQRARAQAAEDARRREIQEANASYRESPHGDDCDDTRRDVHPGASEICDGRDNNCDGAIDEGQTLRRYLDADGDGHGDASRAMDVCPIDISNAARSAESLGGGWLVEVGNDCNDQDPAQWRGCQ